MDILANLATQAASRVVVKTSITPETVIFDARDTSPSLLDVLGVKANVRVYAANGSLLFEYGEPAPTDAIRAAIYYGAAALVGFALVATLARAMR